MLPAAHRATLRAASAACKAGATSCASMHSHMHAHMYSHTNGNTHTHMQPHVHPHAQPQPSHMHTTWASTCAAYWPALGRPGSVGMLHHPQHRHAGQSWREGQQSLDSTASIASKRVLTVVERAAHRSHPRHVALSQPDCCHQWPTPESSRRASNKDGTWVTTQHTIAACVRP